MIQQDNEAKDNLIVQLRVIIRSEESKWDINYLDR